MILTARQIDIELDLLADRFASKAIQDVFEQQKMCVVVGLPGNYVITRLYRTDVAPTLENNGSVAHFKIGLHEIGIDERPIKEAVYVFRSENYTKGV